MLAPQLIVPPSTYNSHHLHQPPDRDLWLGDLRLECFDEVLALSEGELIEALAAIGRDLPGRDALVGALGLRHASTEVMRHLLLVARFLEQKKTAALEIVAREQLREEELESWRTPSGRLHRLPVAILLYAAAPESLLALLLWDRWHSRRRVSWRLEGRHRHLPDLEPEEWYTLAERVMADLGTSAPFREVQLRAALRRAETGELLFGLREPTHRAALETDDGTTVSGRAAGWLLVSLSQDGARLDVSDHAPARGVAFATRLLRAARGGEVSFAPAGATLDEAALDTFLRAACDPHDDRLPLLEITARVPGRTDGLTVTLTGPGQARAEGALAAYRQVGPLAMDHRDVISLKVGFEGRYRFTLEPAEEGDQRVLWYSDRERDKDVARRFEEHLRRHLGISVVPRPQARRTVQDEKAPPRGSSAWWRALLAPVVDAPAPWMAAAWAELARDGLVTLRRSGAMSCGTPYVDARTCGLDDHDCAGTIELGWGDVDEGDPLLQLPEAEAVCPVCDRVWRPGRYRLPLVERVRVTVDLDRLGLRLYRAVATVARMEPYEGEPGVYEARTPTGRYYVAFTALLKPSTSFAVGQGLAGRTAWVKLDGEEGAGLPVSLVLADPTVLGRAWGMPVHGEVGAEREPGPRDVPRLERAEVTEAAPRNRLSLRGSTVYLDDVPVLAAQAKSQRALLAVFIHLAQEDQRQGRAERRGHAISRVLAEAGLIGLGLHEVEVRKQISRMNMASRTATMRAGLAPIELVEKARGGYRLTVGVEVEDGAVPMGWVR